MPDAAMLRRILSPTEQSVLRLAGEGTKYPTIDEMLKLSAGTAEAMVPAIRRKVEQAARQNGGREERVRIRPGDEVECACGTTFTARMIGQRKCPACRELGDAPLVETIGNGHVDRDIVDAALEAAGLDPSGEDAKIEMPADEPESAAVLPDPPIGSSAGTPEFVAPDPDPAPEPEPARAVKRKPGALLAEAIETLRERGPMRQTELRAVLRLGSPEMAALMRKLRDHEQVVVGAPVDRSPVLSLRGEGAIPVEEPPLPEESPEEAPAVEPEPLGKRDPQDGHPLSEARARYFAYLESLIVRAKTRACPEHVYERIEKMMQVGPPS